jgi:hypothetical protein
MRAQEAAFRLVIMKSSCLQCVCRVFNASVVIHQPLYIAIGSRNRQCIGASYFNDVYISTIGPEQNQQHIITKLLRLKITTFLLMIQNEPKVTVNLQFFSSLLSLQPCEGLGLLHGFIIVHFSEVGSLAPRRNPNLSVQGLHFI